VVGNGRLLVNFDSNGYIRDLYFPLVGMENHVGGHECRLGVWVGGKFSWTGEEGWERDFAYVKEALVTEVLLRNRELGLELRIHDAVHYFQDLFLRRVRVTNLAQEEREVRLFHSQDFHLYGLDIGDTAYYEPSLHAIVHYKNRRYFLIGGDSGEEGIHQFSIGIKEFEGAEGTWKDAEDGVLSNHPIAQGSVDSTVSLQSLLPPGGERVLHYWIAAGRSFPEVQDQNAFVKAHGVEKLLQETESYHRSWVNKQEIEFGPLPEKVVDLFKKSLLILRSQISNNGAIIAANDSDILRFSRDTYSYVWPRDGALVAYALSRTGYGEISRKFFEFCAPLLTPRGYFLHKYNPNGTVASSWHPRVGPNEEPQLPIQEDETALVLHSLWSHYEQFRDIEFAKGFYDSFVKRAADFLDEFRHPGTKLPLPSYDLWEERRGIFTFTSATVYAGLQAAARFADLFGDPEDADRYRGAAEEVKNGVLEYLFDRERGRFLRMVTMDPEGNLTKDPTVDSSVYGVFEFGLLPPDDPRVVASMEAVEERLWCKTPVGGIARYEGDSYQRIRQDPNVPGNPWILCTLWLAKWYISQVKNEEELSKSLRLLGWVADHAGKTGVLPEQVHPYTGNPLSVSPLTWSHSTYAIGVIRYLEKLNELKVCEGCGTPLYLCKRKKLW
jgi:oligosaccharide amylase